MTDNVDNGTGDAPRERAAGAADASAAGEAKPASAAVPEAAAGVPIGQVPTERTAPPPAGWTAESATQQTVQLPVVPAMPEPGQPTWQIPGRDPYFPPAPPSDQQVTAVQPFPAVTEYPYGSPPPSAVGGAEAAPGAPRRSGSTAGLLAAALAVALVAGGIGGAIGSTITHHNDSHAAATTSGATSSAAAAGSITQVAQQVLPSVVMIKVSGNQREGEGSGVILTPDGFILTNNHVANGGGPDGKMTVVFSDGSSVPATLVGADSTYDIAVIKVNGKSGLTPIQVGTSRGLQVGQQVVAIGSPLGLADTVTTGIVSALNRPVATSGESGDQGSVIDAIQTDAAINPGNSGGALVDMSNKLIGINTAIASLGSAGPDQQSGSIGLGFAIPVDQAARIGHQLMTTGHAMHPVIGILVKDADNGSGAQVQSLTPASPAGKAGIPVGAVVTKVDNRLIDSSDALVAAVRAYQPGDTVNVTYTDPQNGISKTVHVTLAGQSDSGDH
jgi:putative serine protease PepD